MWERGPPRSPGDWFPLASPHTRSPAVRRLSCRTRAAPTSMLRVLPGARGTLAEGCRKAPSRLPSTPLGSQGGQGASPTAPDQAFQDGFASLTANLPAWEPPSRSESPSLQLNHVLDAARLLRTSTSQESSPAHHAGVNSKSSSHVQSANSPPFRHGDKQCTNTVAGSPHDNPVHEVLVSY